LSVAGDVFVGGSKINRFFAGGSSEFKCFSVTATRCFQGRIYTTALSKKLASVTQVTNEAFWLWTYQFELTLKEI
jgi:hypothetical protein